MVGKIRGDSGVFCAGNGMSRAGVPLVGLLREALLAIVKASSDGAVVGARWS